MSIQVGEDGRCDTPPSSAVDVLFVINSLTGGGAERVLTTLLRNSGDRAKHFRISLALLDSEPRAYEPPPWLAVHQLDSRHGLLRSLVQLTRLVKTSKPDVAISFLTRSNVATAVAMSIARKPYILSERAHTKSQLGTGIRGIAARAIVRLTYRRAPRIISVSKGVGSQLAKWFAVSSSRITTIYNPVDVKAVRQAASQATLFTTEPPYAVAVGRLVRGKNFEMAIRSFAEARLPGRFVILGDGPEREALLRLSRDLNIGDRVLLPGFVENPYPIIAGANFLVLSSNAEGFPNVIVEALACGVPVVATDCASGPAEILEASYAQGSTCAALGRGGLLVPVGDVAAMAKAFVRMSNSGFRDRLASQAIGRAAEFSVSEAVDRYWHAIQLVLAESRPRKGST